MPSRGLRRAGSRFRALPKIPHCRALSESMGHFQSHWGRLSANAAIRLRLGGQLLPANYLKYHELDLRRSILYISVLRETLYSGFFSNQLQYMLKGSSELSMILRVEKIHVLLPRSPLKQKFSFDSHVSNARRNAFNRDPNHTRFFTPYTHSVYIIKLFKNLKL